MYPKRRCPSEQDYDDEGFTYYHDAIVEGLASTGTIISSAGLVMLASFGGLLFSVNPGLSQIGFMLCFAVAADTFVVEAVLVPAFMGLLCDWNWWPRDPSPKRDSSKSSSSPRENGGVMSLTADQEDASMVGGLMDEDEDVMIMGLK